MVVGSVVAVVVVRRSFVVRRSLLLSLPLSLPVVSPLPLSLPFDFRIALHSTACATSSHIISSHPSYLTLSFGYLLAGCCLLLLTRSPTPLLAHSITPFILFPFSGGQKKDVKHVLYNWVPRHHDAERKPLTARPRAFCFLRASSSVVTAPRCCASRQLVLERLHRDLAAVAWTLLQTSSRVAPQVDPR